MKLSIGNSASDMSKLSLKNGDYISSHFVEYMGQLVRCNIFIKISGQIFLATIWFGVKNTYKRFRPSPNAYIPNIMISVILTFSICRQISKIS